MIKKYTNKKIPVDAIRISEFHWDRSITAEDISELADNIAEYGLLHPVAVRPYGNGGHMYELLTGERRLTAVKLLGWEKIDARITKCDDIDAEIISYSENLKTRKPTPVEWDTALARMVELYEQRHVRNIPKTEYKGGKKDISGQYISKNVPKIKRSRGRPKSPRAEAVREIAGEIRMSTKSVMNALKRNKDLIPSASRALDLKTITVSQATYLAGLPANQQQMELRQLVMETRDKTEQRRRNNRIKDANERPEVLTDILCSAFLDCADANKKLESALSLMASMKKLPKQIRKTPNIKQAIKTRDALIAIFEALDM